jgi:ribonuclease P protein component
MKLGRDRRLRSRREFQHVREAGTSFPGRFLVLGKASAEGPARFGIITTKKLGNAVTRNKIRRRVRSLLVRHGESIPPGFWLTWIGRHRAASASFADMEVDFLALLQRAGIPTNRPPGQ